MDPRRLHLLRTVALCGSVAGAARALHVSAPAVSQQLARLEREAGTTLLHRSRHGVVLTAAGERLAMRAERIEQELLAARRDLAELTGAAPGTVRLAAFQSVIPRLVVPALDIAAATHPALRVEVVEAYGPPALARLRSGELDAVLVEYDHDQRRPRQAGITHVPLLFDPYRLVVPKSWHLTPDSPADLTGRPWVAGPPGTACDVALRRLGAEARDVCVEFPSVLALVAAGRGAAIVPRLALGHPDTVVCTDIDLGGRDILLAHRRSGARTDPALAALTGALTRAVSSR